MARGDRAGTMWLVNFAPGKRIGGLVQVNRFHAIEPGRLTGPIRISALTCPSTPPTPSAPPIQAALP